MRLMRILLVAAVQGPGTIEPWTLHRSNPEAAQLAFSELWYSTEEYETILLNYIPIFNDPVLSKFEKE